MTTQTSASAAIKPLFEENPGAILQLGLDEDVLSRVMSELTRTYIAAREFILATKAAKLLGNEQDYYLVFEAMQSPELAAAHFKQHTLYDEYVFLLLKAGTAEELRKHIQLGTRDVVVKILTQLKSVTELLDYGREWKDLYFATRKEEGGKHSSNTDDILLDAVMAYKAADEVSDKKLSKELIEFGTELQEHDGIRTSYFFSPLRDDELFHPLTELYTTSGAADGFGSAAYVYRVLYKHHKKKEYLILAAEMFITAGYFERALEIASDLAMKQDIVSAIQIANKTPKKVDFELLEQYATLATEQTTRDVKEAVINYLKRHFGLMPFIDRHTFWCRSNGNDTWEHCVTELNYAAGRFNQSRISCRNGQAGHGSIAKPLYASDKAEEIEKIHDVLVNHLFVGWMLSGITYEIDNGSHSSSRKYEHPTYAAWRTFNEIGSRELKETGLPSDALMKDLLEYLADIDMGGESCNGECYERLESKLPEMQLRTKAVFDTVVEEIGTLLEQL